MEPNSTAQTGNAIESQAGAELALRFFAFRLVPYRAGLDVHEYLDDALLKIATDEKFDFAHEAHVFQRTFKMLDDALGDKAFKRWNGRAFSGKFLASVFEVMSTGVSHNVSDLEEMTEADRNAHIREVAQRLWADPTFSANSGAGVRGTTRLARLLPIAAAFVKP